MYLNEEIFLNNTKRGHKKITTVYQWVLVKNDIDISKIMCSIQILTLKNQMYDSVFLFWIHLEYFPKKKFRLNCMEFYLMKYIIPVYFITCEWIWFKSLLCSAYSIHVQYMINKHDSLGWIYITMFRLGLK